MGRVRPAPRLGAMGGENHGIGITWNADAQAPPQTDKAKTLGVDTPSSLRSGLKAKPQHKA